ncbi:DnaB-like helicase C-terminal domain-containing protein [Borreliella andersonii]|uniref:DnaB-like helicase C-terminal domain-containing protein n=1 Tax=Borrelia andersonii TaxID=42109 RepID=UPI003AB14321
MNKNELIDYNKSLFELNNLSLYIESTQGIQIYELKAQSRQMKKNSNVEIIFLDYISLITMSHNDIPRFEQVAFLSHTIRVLALELEIPIIALSQVARSTAGKEPSLATLRESGALDQDANIVFFYIKRIRNIKKIIIIL